MTCLVALLVGSLATWIIMRGRKRENSLLQPRSVELLDSSNEVKTLQNQLAESRLKVEELENKAATLSEKLKLRETELINLQKEFENLVNLTPEGRNDAILNKYKADIEKKSKEIENQEEEIEELKDELSATKKKLSKAKSEVEEATEAIERTNQELKKTESELKYVTQERDELQKENAIKNEAIEFINAVLTAQPADDKNATLVDNKVSQIESVILDQYLPSLDQYSSYYEDKDDWKNIVRDTITSWGVVQRKSWLKEKKVVAFIGEFSAGKTSIVNRILSQDNPDSPTLPVSSKATTAIATYISYSYEKEKKFLSLFTNTKGDLKKLSEEMFQKVDKELLGKINASSLIRHFVLSIKNDNLKGLSILDTPGFSSNDEEDQDRTLDVIKEAHALFWVMDANTGEINRTSLKIIADNIQDLPLYIIINKSDTKSIGELNQLEAHIRQTMERAGISVKGYVRFSQKSRLDELMNIIQSLESKKTNFDITSICLRIRSDIDQLNKNLKSLRQKIRKYETEISEYEDTISSGLGEMQESSQRVASIPQLKSHWFSADDYRMDQEEYQELSEHCNFMEQCSEDIAIIFPDLRKKVEEHMKLSESQQTYKEQTKGLQDILKQLENTLKSLDLKQYETLQQNLEYKIGGKTKGMQIKSASSFDENEGFNAFQKAMQFQNQDEREEAKFWFIRSAKLGYKDGEIYCKINGYKY